MNSFSKIFGPCIVLGWGVVWSICWAVSLVADEPVRTVQMTVPRVSKAVAPASADPAPRPMPAATRPLPAMPSPAVVRSPFAPSPFSFLGWPGPRTAMRGYVPGRGRSFSSQYVSDPRNSSGDAASPPIEAPPVPGEIIEGLPVPGDASCDTAAGGETGWGILPPCIPVYCIPVPFLTLENTTVTGGVQGFKGPPDRSVNGNFGFNESVNWGGSLPIFPRAGIGMQVGVRGVHSDFSGTSLDNGSRDQVFTTAGLFRRVDWGVQGGVVIDYLHDDWWYQADLVQVRGELSWVYPDVHEWGFWFTSSIDDADNRNSAVLQGPIDLETTDIYAFFYRARFGDCQASNARLYGGFTGRRDGIVGADLHLPMTDAWALETGFAYLIPREDIGAGGASEESWNVGINLVWYPRRNARTGAGSYYRPLFSVADNGSLMMDVR